MNTPIISIIVPVYNTMHYLEQCLSSLCNQTLQNIEILCIDDGSSDGSKFIIKKFCTNDPRVHLISQENLGVCEARKHGIRLAKGRYIGFVDSDDYVDNTFFENLYTVACRDNADIVATTGIFIFNDKEKILSQKFSYITTNIRSLSTEERAKLFLSTVSTCNKIYTTNICKKIIPFYSSKQNFAEDNLFTIPALIIAKRISLVTDPCYFYRQHNKSTCHQNINILSIYNVYKMYCSILNIVESFKLRNCDYRIYKKYILRRRNWDCFQLSQQLPYLVDQLLFIYQTQDVGFQFAWILRKIRALYRTIIWKRY